MQHREGTEFCAFQQVLKEDRPSEIMTQRACFEPDHGIPGPGVKQLWFEF